MTLLFIADPLQNFKIYKDTTFAMMREAQRRGHGISACEPRDLGWQTAQPVTASVRDITLAAATRWQCASPSTSPGSAAARSWPRSPTSG